MDRFKEMELFAQMHLVPIMEADSMAIMLERMRQHKVLKVLEIGTAIGYSALRMAAAGMSVVTIERDVERLAQAERFLTRFDKNQMVTVIAGDALEVSEKVERFAPFDALFIDAAKGQYRRFFELYEPFVKDKGIIFTDNVLFKGLVNSEAEISSKRTRQIVKKIRGYNDWLMANPDFETEILAVGDGLAVSRKK